MMRNAHSAGYLTKLHGIFMLQLSTQQTSIKYHTVPTAKKENTVPAPEVLNFLVGETICNNIYSAVCEVLQRVAWEN